jgi:hypothetical protein
MKRNIVVSLTLAIAAVALVFAQQTKSAAPVYTPLEVRSLFPRETSPAMYEQVPQQEIQSLATQGWELVSVVPYVYRNEERGTAINNKPAVTQTYPAYFFKRARPRP